MNIHKKISILAFLSLFCVGIYFYAPIYTYLEAQAIETLYTQVGNLPVHIKIKEKIDLLAQEVGLTRPLIVNKMNSNGTRLFGYHNCFIAYPRICLNLITFNQPHMFISEGFFEDLSPDEQKFILGHELIHAREAHHGYYFTLITTSIRIVIMLCIVLIIYLLALYFKNNVLTNFTDQLRYTFYIIAVLLLSASFGILSHLAENYFRRQIEKEADILSIEILKTHKGAQEIFDRWHKEFKMPLESSYGDIFSDHPSLATRKNYCLNERPML